jgi:hypothetical protein
VIHPVGVAQLQFLNGIGGLPVVVLLVVGSEEQVQAMEDMVPGLTELRWSALAEREEVVNKDTNVRQGLA